MSAAEAHGACGGSLQLRWPVPRHRRLAESLRLENPTTTVPGDLVTDLDYDVCTG